MKAIIFARVSSKEQEDGQSIPAQVRRLTEYALKKHFQIEKTFQITESSTKDTRKQFDEIITYVKKSKEPYALITDTVDRLQRSFRETPLLDELRKQGKLELHFLREGLIVNSSSNSAQLLQWDIGVLFASSYVRQLSDNVKRSQEQCIRSGQWISKAPYGYKNSTLPSGEKSIDIDPERAPFVVKVFELYAKGNNSFHTVALKIGTQAHPKTSRGKPISAKTVEQILKNPFYIGLMKIKNQLYTHKYPKLISESLFNSVQEIIANHHKLPVKFAGKPILLRGFIRCKNCGGAMTGDIKKQKYVYYSCHNAKRICTKKWVREELLLETITQHFEHIQLSDTHIDEIIDYLQEYEVQEHQSSKKLQEQLNIKLNQTQERISKLIDLHIDGKVDSESYRFKLTEYKAEQQRLLLELRSYEDRGEVQIIAAKDVLYFAKNTKQIFLSSNLDEKQQLLGFFFSNLLLDHGKLDVELRELFSLFQKHQLQEVWRG